MEEAQAFRTPPVQVLVSPHVGDLPALGQFIRVDGLGVEVCAVKLGEDADRLVVRLYNPTSADRTARLSAMKPIRQARLLSLKEKELAPLNVSNGVVEVPVAKGRIVTVEFQ